MARIWMENGMVELAEEKMLKSVGNIRLLHGALDEYGRDALIAYFVKGHYRKPIAFSEEELEDAARGADRIRNFCLRLDREAPAPQGLDAYVERFFDALADDFQTPTALRVLFEWIAEGNRRLDNGESLGPGRLGEMLHVLGVDNLMEEKPERPEGEAERLLDEREQARAARDFEAADRKRAELAALGFEVRDTPQGPQLVRRA